jgi:hypothetical protein
VAIRGNLKQRRIGSTTATATAAAAAAAAAATLRAVVLP